MTNFTPSVVWVCALVNHTKCRTQIKGVSGQDVEDSNYIWEDGGNCIRCFIIWTFYHKR